MTKTLKFLAALIFALPVFAQAQVNHSQAELDQLLAPVALYPDPLLSQILMAATYPRDVVEAADWSRANPGLQGDDAVRAVQNEDWDPSVKSLVAFPQLLARMEEKIDWTRDLGDAFLGQEAQVMDTVQQLRQRAQAAGNLQSDERMLVQQDGLNISLQLVSARAAYVPYYDPMVIYGTWWWPAYRPVVWAPWPGYARFYRPGFSVGFWWGGPIGLSANFFYGGFDWHRHEVRVLSVNNYYYRPAVLAHRVVVSERGRWQHEPQHRRGVEYRQAEVRQRYAQAQGERRDDGRKRQAAMDAQRRAQQQAEAQRQSRQEQRPSMPAAQAPQQPRAEHHEKRDDRRDDRRDDKREQRQEHGQKG